MRVVVRTTNNESQLEAQPSTKGREIFGLLCKSFGIQENWYFGLMYLENENEIWIDGSKKSLRDMQRVIAQLQFKVKYYPEDVSEELIEKVTIEFFFLQVKSNIIKDEIYCPSDTCALLASYSLQAKFGDYNPDEHNEKVLKKVKLLPERVLKQHSMGLSEWQDSIINMWIKHKSLDEEEAMLEYLKLAQNLEMYGVKFFNIQNRKGTGVLLGVTALGLNIYKTDDKLNPQISFPWSEIRNLKFKDRKFSIKPTDKTAKDFVFFTQSPRASKYILNLGIGNHSLYIRRRKPDSPEVAKLREKTLELRKNKSLQKQKYYSEKSAREEAERRESEYKLQIQTMRKEMETNQASLMEAQNTIRKLQEQLEDLQRSKEELEQQRHELEEMMARLEQSKNMEAAERQKLEDEIRAKHDEVQRIQDEVQLKDAETKRLQEEVEEARRREEEIRQEKLEEAARIEEERRQRELEDAQKKDNEKELEQLEGADNTLPELQEVNDQLKEQLKMLQSKLGETRKQEEDTELDKIHRVNLLEGRDKYKTLADIRRGNTVRRVEMFENM